MPAKKPKIVKVAVEMTEYEHEELAAKARRAGTTVPLLLLRSVISEPAQTRDPAPRAAPRRPLDAALVQEVVEALAREGLGFGYRRAGGTKVFIVRVWRRLKEMGYQQPLDAFKGDLVRWHRESKLSLTRCDLVEAFDPKDVAESEARYLSGTFHFVAEAQ